MPKLWGRKYKITVSDKMSGKGWDVSNLRCTFHVEKVIPQVSNISVVNIFNLSPETESWIIKEGNRVTVDAGYDASEISGGTVKEFQYGNIYDGDIIQIIRTKDNNLDYQLSLICLDGQDFLNQNFVMVSLAASSNPRKVIDTIASKARVPITTSVISDDLDNTKLPRGKILFGQPRDYLRNISYANNGVFWIENNKLTVQKYTDIPKDSAIELTPQSGLIGYPTQVLDGVEIKCLLDPRIKLQGLVKINNEAVRRQQGSRGALITPLDRDGEYQVVKITHSGDTRGIEWYTSMLGVNRDGAGKIPLLMETTKQTPLGGSG